MKKMILLLMFVLMSFYGVTSAENQVSATGDGGNWEDPTAWTQGYAPVAGNPVEDVSVVWGRSISLNTADAVFGTNLVIGYGVGASPVSTLTMNGGTLTGTNLSISYESYGSFIMNDGFADIFQTNVGAWGAATTNGYMEMNGGLFTTDWMVVCLNVDGTGHIQMNGGQLDVGAAWGMGPGSPNDPTLASPSIDMAGGVITAGYNIADIVQGYINDGYITAYGSAGTPIVEWDNPQYPGKTVLYGIPEPLTLSLLGLGGLALIRRRRAQQL